MIDLKTDFANNVKVWKDYSLWRVNHFETGKSLLPEKFIENVIGQKVIQSVKENKKLEEIVSWAQSLNIIQKSTAIKLINYLFASKIININIIHEQERIGIIRATKKKAMLVNARDIDQLLKETDRLSLTAKLTVDSDDRWQLEDPRASTLIQWKIKDQKFTSFMTQVVCNQVEGNEKASLLFLQILKNNDFYQKPNEDMLDLWPIHDLEFDRKTRNYDDYYDRTGSYRFGLNNQWAKELDLDNAENAMKYHHEIGLPPYSQRITSNNSKKLTLDELETLYSRAFANLKPREMPEKWEHKKYISGRCHRPYASAGGIYEQTFYLIINNKDSDDNKGSVYKYSCSKQRLSPLEDKEQRRREIFEYMKRCWGSEESPKYLLLVVANYAALSFKYSNIAYRLMLINTGCALTSFYRACHSLNLGCCPGGSGPSQAVYDMLELREFEEVPVLEVGFGKLV